MSRNRTAPLLLPAVPHLRPPPDARFKIKTLGDFGYFFGYMSQPKFQLNTFKAWAGKSSDISYYLNSHHVDVHVWAMESA